MEITFNISKTTYFQLKGIGKIENCSVQTLIEKAIKTYTSQNIEVYEDKILLKLMLEAKEEGFATEKEFYEALNSPDK